MAYLYDRISTGYAKNGKGFPAQTRGISFDSRHFRIKQAADFIHNAL